MFKPINVVKLTTKMVLDRKNIKLLAVGSDMAVEAKEKDAVLRKFKELLHLIHCFLIYINILVYFTQKSLRQFLLIEMLAYVKQLLGFSTASTFESVQQYHFFHSMRIWQEINDGTLWEQGNNTLEQKTLRPKPQSDFATSKACFCSNPYRNQFTLSGIQSNSNWLN